MKLCIYSVTDAMNQENKAADSQIKHKSKSKRKIELSNICSVSVTTLHSKSAGLGGTGCNSSASVSNEILGGQCSKPRKIKKRKRSLKKDVTTSAPVRNVIETKSPSKEDNSNTIKSPEHKPPKKKRRTQVINLQAADMGIPEVTVTGEFTLHQNKRQSKSREEQARIKHKEDIIVLSNETSGDKRKSFNDSIVILQEVNGKPRSSPEKRRLLQEASSSGVVSSTEISNDSVINLCDDDVSIIEVDIVSPKQNSAPTEDIILLDSNPRVAEGPKNAASVAFKGKKRKRTCTVTTACNSPPSNYDSILNVFRQNDKFADNTVTSTSASFAIDKNGRYHSSRHRNRKPGNKKWGRNEVSSRNLKTTSSSSNNSSQQPPAPADGSNPYGSNIYNPNPQTSQKSGALRPIIIDGSNVALGHSQGARIFSCRGLQICINYFTKRGHQVIAFVPQFRRGDSTVADRHIFDELQKAGQIVFTPSRRVDGRLVVSYDDRYIVQYAAEFGGVIVSTDNYRDLLQENEAWKDTIENRLLMFTWVGDLLMFPLDPLGRNGPKLDEFLRFPPEPST